eukprot:CAMPEP_0119040354 /NCGR_PEP_ID=MMETSP1177-20130426/10246_1 /TAXON_ID=2985 /ORGANISM="Ochromonas sp, Strain CCMP1899" /LENGTH=279 /DNA_ID=CAMNT_0007005317 /DNA_START=194 /DNA_END=1033 /DNA_ORIENTATION=+
MKKFNSTGVDRSDTEIQNVLSEEQIQTYQKDGVLLVRQLVSGEELAKAMDAVAEMSKKQSGFNEYKNIEFQTWSTNDALKDVALSSKVPKAAAQLIGLTSKATPIRLLKDAVLCFTKGNIGCGWHVDDKFFWPCEDEVTGVNVWIALSPMTAKQGGGLAVTPGSHKVNFAQRAIDTIRQGNYQTCQMETLAPDIHDKLEAMKVVYDMEPGDAIIHDRYLFHRSDSFHEDVDENLTLNRYSIRYMPEEALSTDHSGQPLKDHGDKFPQVLPQVDNIESQV